MIFMAPGSVAAIILGCLLLITGNADAAPTPKQGLQDSRKCKEMIRISRADNPWKGMTDSYAQEQENRNIKASAIGKEDAPVRGLEKYVIGGDQLMAKKAGLKRIAVNDKYFSDLKKADATRTEKGKQQPIGRYLDKSFLSMTPRSLARFLLDAQIVDTYWHIGAELCCVDEVDDGREYRARFTGRHIYYTNSREEQKLDFVIRIDKTTGEMFLLGN